MKVDIVNISNIISNICEKYLQKLFKKITYIEVDKKGAIQIFYHNSALHYVIVLNLVAILLLFLLIQIGII